MTRDQAVKFVARLDAIEAALRGTEGRVTALRRELQEEFRIKCWDDPKAVPSEVIPPDVRTTRGGAVIDPEAPRCQSKETK